MAEGASLLREALGHLPGSACDGRARRILLAVSGGADSLALLVLAAEAAPFLPGLSFAVATVDHDLRPEAAAEAAAVGRIATRLGLSHATLRWVGDKPAAGLQAAARSARYRLLEEHAREIGAVAVATAHHLDDQIETHLLAQRRKAGARGLAGMRTCRALAPGLALLRPFLGISGLRLTASVTARGLEAADDPSNRDRRFDRVRLRDDLRAGRFAQERIRQDLARYAAARDRDDLALAVLLQSLERNGHLTLNPWGRAVLHGAALADADPDLAILFLGRLVRALGGAEHAPGWAATGRFLDAFLAGRAATLGGVTMGVGDRAILHREFGRKGPAPAAPGGRRCVFDGRFEVVPPPQLGAFAAGSVVVPFGALGLGNAALRTLPVLLDRDGAPLAAARPTLAKLRSGLPELPCRPRIAFRLWADLPRPLMPAS